MSSSAVTASSSTSKPKLLVYKSKVGWLTIISAWDYPNIKGLKNFKGKLCHSADYDESTELEGKKVAVIGIGSSGVQIIPNILPTIEHLYCWVRSPTWMTAGFAQKFAGKDGANYKC